MLIKSPNVTHIGAGSAIAVAALVLTTRWLDPTAAQRDPEAAVLLMLWVAATILSVWLVASLAYWRRRLTSPSAGPSKLDRLCLPGSKRLAQTMLAASLTILPACGASTPSAPQLSYVGEVEPAPSTSAMSTPSTPTTATNVSTTAPTTTAPTTTAAATSSTTDPSPDTTPLDPADEPAKPDQAGQTDGALTRSRADTHVVERGEHLWGIAEATLQAHDTGHADTVAVAAYWRDLIDANVESLSSGNPNLIYPGETLILPPL